MNCVQIVMHAAMIVGMLQLSACQPASRPSESFDMQRNQLKQANQLQQQLQHQLETRMQASDDSQK